MRLPFRHPGRGAGTIYLRQARKTASRDLGFARDWPCLGLGTGGRELGVQGLLDGKTELPDGKGGGQARAGG